MEVAIRYGQLMTKLSRISFDAEATLFGPFILIATLLPYMAMFWSFFTFLPLDAMWRIVVQFATLSTILTVLICGVALIVVSKPRRVRSLLWLPFVYFYWSFQALIAVYAVVLIILRRPRVWTKTDKQGVLMNPAFMRKEHDLA
jgi:amino acid transporter